MFRKSLHLDDLPSRLYPSARLRWAAVPSYTLWADRLAPCASQGADRLLRWSDRWSYLSRRDGRRVRIGFGLGGGAPLLGDQRVAPAPHASHILRYGVARVVGVVEHHARQGQLQGGYEQGNDSGSVWAGAGEYMLRLLGMEHPRQRRAHPSSARRHRNARSRALLGVKSR